jgi:hypothetical protein
MSDNKLPITLTGQYKGFQVAIQVDSTLDNLDRLVERLQARGVEPLHQAPAPAPNGDKSDYSGLAAFEGVFVRSMRPDSERGPALRVSLRGEGEDVRTFDIWDATQSEQLLTVARANVSRIRVRYVTKANGKYTNYTVKHWQLVA